MKQLFTQYKGFQKALDQIGCKSDTDQACVNAQYAAISNPTPLDKEQVLRIRVLNRAYWWVWFWSQNPEKHKWIKDYFLNRFGWEINNPDWGTSGYCMAGTQEPLAEQGFYIGQNGPDDLVAFGERTCTPFVGADWFKRENLWEPAENRALPGDVFFSDEKNKTAKEVTHASMVVYDDGGSFITVIEFNYSGGILERQRSRDTILGFGKLDVHRAMLL